MSERNNPIWPVEDEAYERRMQAIMSNGPTGEHYFLVEIDEKLRALEAQMDNLEQARREYLNRNNLNKVPGNE